MNGRRFIPGVFTTAVLLALTLPVCTQWEGLRRVGFCLPPAVFAASVLGVPCVPEPDGSGYMIPVSPMPIHVVRECSAVRYFCITAAILAGLCVERRRWGAAFFMFPVAYVLTLVANTARMVCGWLAQGLAMGVLPARYLAAVHMSVGAVCFIIFLILAYGLVERSLSHGRSEITAG